jgi:hypothetical protein
MGTHTAKQQAQEPRDGGAKRGAEGDIDSGDIDSGCCHCATQ